MKGERNSLLLWVKTKKEMRLVLYLSTQKSISTFLKVEGNFTTSRRLIVRF